MNKLDELYLNWLIDKVCSDDEKEDYCCLMDFLYEKEYVPLRGLDENLAINALRLRKMFIEDCPPAQRLIKNYEFSYDYCSMIELLVYLAISMEEIMTNTDFGDRTGQWFWIMMKQLHLIDYVDEQFYLDEVGDLVDDFLENGVIFGKKYKTKTCQIWQQINIFISEYAENDGEIW